MAQKEDLEFRKTEDYASMVELGRRSGLETNSLPELAVAYGFFDGDRLVACAGLKTKGGRFSIECLAVEEALRGKGLGAELVHRLESDARRMGADTLWALARRPAFFQAIGYSIMDHRAPGAPDISECLQCKQYRESCHPSIVAKRL
ncbi:MAG: GNAT family N-acetyltransferase [Thermoplasmata archaeon]|nr:GNAT family N-acetyltransferase [Thermoplasmata archaeon]